MKNGVLLVIGNTLICRRIKAHTRQLGIEQVDTASHVAYIFWWDYSMQHQKMKDSEGNPLEPGWYVIESHFHSGVAVFPYRQWKSMNFGSFVKFYEDESYNLKTMLDSISEKYAVKSILAIKLQTDQEFFNTSKIFKFFGLINNLLTKLIPSKDYPGIYCSELLCLANDIITKAIGKKPYESWPSDLQKYYLDKEKEVVA
jgi:hypothetical protein